MSESTTEQRQYSWVAPSSQSSQSIIEGKAEPPTTGQEQQQKQGADTEVPLLPRRSSHNYEHDLARFSNFSSERPAGDNKGKAGEVSGRHHERTKSFNREDQKRDAHTFMMTEGDRKNFSEASQ